MSSARPLLRSSSGAPHYLLRRFSLSRKLARRHCAHGLCMRKQDLLTTCSGGSHSRGSLPAAIVPMDCACVNAFQELPFVLTQPAITACITHRVARSLRHTAYCHCMRDTACNTQHAIRACNNMQAMQCMQHTACHHN